MGLAAVPYRHLFTDGLYSEDMSRCCTRLPLLKSTDVRMKGKSLYVAKWKLHCGREAAAAAAAVLTRVICGSKTPNDFR